MGFGTIQLQTLGKAVSIHISKALALCDGRVEGKSGAAQILGIKPGTLRYRMKKLGIPFGRKAD